MKKLLIFFTLCLLPVAALADTIIKLPSGESFDAQLLTDGNQIHVLTSFTTTEEESRDENKTFTKTETQVTCYVLNDKNELEPCQSNCEILHRKAERQDTENSSYAPSYFSYGRMMTYQNSIYLYEQEGGTLHLSRWSPSTENACEAVADIPLEQFGIEIYDKPDSYGMKNSFYRMTMDDTTLYVVADQTEGIVTKYVVYAYDLKNSTSREIYKSGFRINSIYPADNNQLLIDSQKEYEILNLETGEVRKTGKKGYKDLLISFISDRKGGFYFLGRNSIYQYDQDMNAKLLYKLPAGVHASDMFIYHPETHDFVILVTDDNYLSTSLYIIDEDRTAYNTLTLIDFSKDLGTMNSFAPSMEEFHATHDQFAVATTQSITDYDQLNQALVLGGDSFDVMLLDYDALPMANLFKKGYYVDLSDSPEVQDYLASAYPAFRQACMAGDRIAALPLIVRDSTMLINQPLWEELGLPVPTTFGELLDTIAHCLDEGILNEHPLFKSTRFELDARGQVISWDLMVPTECYNTLRYQLLQAYIAGAQRDGELSFQDETFMQLMDKLYGLKNTLDEHDAKRVVGDALLYPDGGLDMVSSSRLYDPNIFHPLLLGVHDAKDIAVPVRLKVLIINPRSPRADLAKEYIAYFAAHPTSTTRCVITTEQPDGIEKPGQPADKESEAATIDDLTSRIEAARAEGDQLTARDLEEQLTLYKESRALTWDVTPEAAQAYYQITPYLWVMDDEGYSFIAESGGKDLTAFDEGRIDAKTLCQRLEQLLQMRRMENQ